MYVALLGGSRAAALGKTEHRHRVAPDLAGASIGSGSLNARSSILGIVRQERADCIVGGLVRGSFFIHQLLRSLDFFRLSQTAVDGGGKQ